jgi:hypothetical protein
VIRQEVCACRRVSAAGTHFNSSRVAVWRHVQPSTWRSTRASSAAYDRACFHPATISDPRPKLRLDSERITSMAHELLCVGMASQRTDWRFFTRLKVDDCVVTQSWCWEEFTAGHEVVASGSGFTTLPAAMRDARRHGFDGCGNSVDGRAQLRRVDDWARGEDVLDRPFGWLNTGDSGFRTGGRRQHAGGARAPGKPGRSYTA